MEVSKSKSLISRGHSKLCAAWGEGRSRFCLKNLNKINKQRKMLNCL